VRDIRDGLAHFAYSLVNACESTLCLIMLLDEPRQRLEVHAAYNAPRRGKLNYRRDLLQMDGALAHRLLSVILQDKNPWLFCRDNRDHIGVLDEIAQKRHYYLKLRT
jgi:hypothetical protein